jgi:diguanylate cyclase (GGDEF)-like protein
MYALKVRWRMANDSQESRKAQTPAPRGEETRARSAGWDDSEMLVSSPWTRSPGRLRFRTLLQRAIVEGAQRPNYHFAVLYVDLDRFTAINDRLGRAAADQLLIEVTRRIRGCLRQTDVVTRLREDEYLVFLDDVQRLASVLDAIDKMKVALRPQFRVRDQEVFVSACIGIALGPLGYSDTDGIVRDAEAAMHRSKAKGPGSHEVFDAKTDQAAKRLLKLETEFRVAIDTNQLRLQYEPIFSLDEYRVAGFEALIRWMHPERGLIYPGEFVPMAEQTGLILPMTRWVLEEACRQLKKWQSQFPEFAPIWLSVNFSPIYIEKSDFARELLVYTSESGVDASKLVVEITESQLLENADDILSGFNTLHNTGIKLWIDDFGAGYSSLAYLVKFPIHALKIDRSFISKLVHDEKSTAIANAIISLAKTLGVSVIAEGIETQEQLLYLRSVACPYGQGHYFAPSLEPRMIDPLFAKKS